MSVGDITSDARGTGARFNTGKPTFELVPLRAIAEYIDHVHGESILDENAHPSQALHWLALWQEAAGDPEASQRYLIYALASLGDGWVECARVFDYGQRKYAPWNWAKGFAWSVPFACAVRHLLAMVRGESTDPESGESHRGHVYCNVVMLHTFARTFVEGDDRPLQLRAPA